MNGKKPANTQLTKTAKLSDLVCHRFYVAANAMIRAYRPYLDELDITYPQYLVLIALWEKDQVEIGDIKQRTRIDGGALSLILKKLEAKRFIRFEKSDSDKRIKLVCLTPNGRDMQDKAGHLPQKLACELPDIPIEDIKNLVDTIDKLIDRIVD